MRASGRLAVRLVIILGLAWYFVAGATRHARDVNTSIGRGDQLAYLWDAQVVYANWHGQMPRLHRGDQREYPPDFQKAYARQHGPTPLLVGQRMRMPVYAGMLALAYRPTLTEQEFFDIAKAWNIRLALLLVGVLAVVFFGHLPPLHATSLTLVVAFGYFIFKAGYAQPEVLFYSLFFATFLACWHLFRLRSTVGSLVLGALAGTLGGLTYLTKAVIPPFMVLFLVVYGADEVVRLVRSRHRGTRGWRTALRWFAWRASAGLIVAICFLAVVSPYALNSKRVFGQYFFNANTTYYMWYDSGVVARAIMWPHTDPEGRIAIDPGRLPNARQYWRTHTVGQIAARIVDGLKDTAVRSYRTFWYLKFVVLYVGFVLALTATGWRQVAPMLRDHGALVLFLLLYAGIYLVGIAFFVVTSDTGGTRFLLAHVTPLLFVCAHVIARSRLRSPTCAGIAISPGYFPALVLIVMGYDLAFNLWPRLMTTYGGF